MKKALSYAAVLAAGFSAGVGVPEPPAEVWHAAYAVTVTDGDTATFAIDLGFSCSVVETLRFWGVDTPEMTGDTREDALRARDWVAGEIVGRPVLVREHGQDSFGRWLAEIRVDGQDLSQELIHRGLGVPYHGGAVSEASQTTQSQCYE